MKISRIQSPGSLSRLAAAVSSSFILTLAGCKKPQPAPEKPKPPVSINVEVQIFSMPRALAVETVLSQPAGTDYATVLKNVQALVGDNRAALVATPTVTTLSGQRAVVESILEHKYPTEYSQPQIPQTFGGNTRATEPPKKVTKTTTIITQETTKETTTSFPMTPTTPTAFEKRDVGITLELEPSINEDHTWISIQVAVSQVALQGTVKYRTEYNGEIEQPEFYAKKITSNVYLKNGGVGFLGTIEPDKTLAKGEDLTEVVFIRATVR